MHGYMMPSIAPKNNPQIIFTWLHYAATTGARMPAKSGNSRLRAISSQKLGGELPVRQRLVIIDSIRRRCAGDPGRRLSLLTVELPQIVERIRCGPDLGPIDEFTPE